MEYLHSKPASVSTTKNGTFWFCGSKPSCHFFCPEKDHSIFARAIVSFQASGCPHPVCHVHQILAKMGVVKNNTKGNGGRPFFVCLDQENPCSFWQWADVVESPKPLCLHGLTSCVRKVKKDRPNQNHLFYCCPNERENACEFFEWKPVEISQCAYRIACLFSSPLGLYQYMVADTGETFTSRKTDCKEAYKEFLQKSVGA